MFELQLQSIAVWPRHVLTLWQTTVRLTRSPFVAALVSGSATNCLVATPSSRASRTMVFNVRFCLPRSIS
jgi:hypothetical protein